MSVPSYINLHKSGEIVQRKEIAFSKLRACSLCPNNCNVDRLQNEKGICNTGIKAIIASYAPHFGEESPLVGQGGSGTIFFGNCNLGCVFCQNYDISHDCEGVEVSSGQLAAIMLSLQKQGCHNINFVTPSHVVPQIIEAVIEAVANGLHIPLVYNSSGYDSIDTLELLDGIIDIYMPDFKFWDNKSSSLYTNVKNYPHIAQEALREMHRQVGDLKIDKNGIASKGLLLRHLVMPNAIEESKKIIQFIGNEISKNTFLNIMDQYRPCGEADKFEEINQQLSHQEYEEVISYATEFGMKRLDKKEWAMFARLFSK